MYLLLDNIYIVKNILLPEKFYKPIKTKNCGGKEKDFIR